MVREVSSVNLYGKSQFTYISYRGFFTTDKIEWIHILNDFISVIPN